MSAVASVEVAEKAKRRRFSAEYKRRIVKEADACKAPGSVGALLRREGLYSSQLTDWRAARDRGELAPGAKTKKRGPRAAVRDPRDKLLADKDRQIALLTARARLLDERRYLCSERTMYRILAENAEVRERRNQRRHPEYTKPELLATATNEVWSWDITKLLGPQKWTYFYLYVVIDIFSRYVVGWLLADGESAALARKLIGESCARQKIKRGQLSVHATVGHR